MPHGWSRAVEADLPWGIKDLLGIPLLTLGPASSLPLSLGSGVPLQGPKALTSPLPIPLKGWSWVLRPLLYQGPCLTTHCVAMGSFLPDVLKVIDPDIPRPGAPGPTDPQSLLREGQTSRRCACPVLSPCPGVYHLDARSAGVSLLMPGHQGSPTFRRDLSKR